MSVVDTPPGLPLADLPAGEFAARPGSYRLARRVFVYVLAIAVLTLLTAARRLYAPLVEVLFIAPMVCISVAAVGIAVRRARLRVDTDGIRWGWHIAGFRMRRHRMREVHVYRDAIAVTPKRGSTWYVTQRDWDRFEGFVDALEAAEVEFSQSASQAPLGARLQSFGIVLDILLIADAVAVTLALFVALSL